MAKDAFGQLTEEDLAVLAGAEGQAAAELAVASGDYATDFSQAAATNNTPMAPGVGFSAGKLGLPAVAGPAPYETTVTGEPTALYPGLDSPVNSTNRLANERAVQNRGIDGTVPDTTGAANEEPEQFADTSFLLQQPQKVGKGGGPGPTVATYEQYASNEAVAKGMEDIAKQRTDQYNEALATTLTARGMTAEGYGAWKAANADLDPQELYQEVSKRMEENDQKVEQVRQYFVQLSGQSVNPARLYANGGTMTASLAVAVGALSQAMLGPGAPNTALNILESALERDIRAQEMTLNNARQAGQGMLQALAASQEILGDRVQAMSATKVALREDLLARLQTAVTMTGNATAQHNLAQVNFDAQEKSFLEKSKLDGQIIKNVTHLAASQLRTGALVKQAQKLGQEMANSAGPQAPAPTAVPVQGGISSSDVAGKPARAQKAGKKVVQPPAAAPTAPAGLSYQSGWAPGEVPDQDADGVPNSVDPDFDPKKPEFAPKAAAPKPASQPTKSAPTEGQYIKDAQGKVARMIVRADNGALVEAIPLPGAQQHGGAVYNTGLYKTYVLDKLNGTTAEAKEARAILGMPGKYAEFKAANDEAVNGILGWIKRNPGSGDIVLTVNADGVYTSPAAQELQRYVSKLSGPALRRYKASANMTDAVSEKERVLALGDLASAGNQVINVEGLRMVAENAARDNAVGLAEMESTMHQHGIAIAKRKNQKEAIDAATGGGIRGIPK